MSCDLDLVCLSHDPILFSYSEVGNYANQEKFDEIAGWLASREELIEKLNDDNIEISHSGMRSAAYFFANHPHCKIGLVTEYREYVDIGHGFPEGEHKKWKPVDRELVQIERRDREAVARLGDPDNDPLLRAEMDRRYLLKLLNERHNK